MCHNKHAFCHANLKRFWHKEGGDGAPRLERTSMDQVAPLQSAFGLWECNCSTKAFWESSSSAPKQPEVLESWNWVITTLSPKLYFTAAPSKEFLWSGGFNLSSYLSVTQSIRHYKILPHESIMASKLSSDLHKLELHPPECLSLFLISVNLQDTNSQQHIRWVKKKSSYEPPSMLKCFRRFLLTQQV